MSINETGGVVIFNSLGKIILQTTGSKEISKDLMKIVSKQTDKRYFKKTDTGLIQVAYIGYYKYKLNLKIKGM